MAVPARLASVTAVTTRSAPRTLSLAAERSVRPFSPWRQHRRYHVGHRSASHPVAGEVPGAGGGWSFVLSDLKTLLETGKAF